MVENKENSIVSNRLEVLSPIIEEQKHWLKYLKREESK